MLYLPNTQFPCTEQRSRTAVNLTNAIVDACDSTIISSLNYPMAVSAVVPDDFSQSVFQFITAGVNLDSAQKISFGAFISAQTNLQSDFIFAVSGHYRFYLTAGVLLPHYFLGRCNSSTVTVSTVAQADQQSTYNVIPGTSSSSYSYDLNSYVIGKYDSSNSNPFCFGICLENPSGAEASGHFYIDLMIRKFASSQIKLNTGSLL